MPFTDYLMNYEMKKTSFEVFFRMSVSTLDELHCQLKKSLQRRASKMRNCNQPVEMLAVLIR